MDRRVVILLLVIDDPQVTVQAWIAGLHLDCLFSILGSLWEPAITEECPRELGKRHCIGRVECISCQQGFLCQVVLAQRLICDSQVQVQVRDVLIDRHGGLELLYCLIQVLRVEEDDAARPVWLQQGRSQLQGLLGGFRRFIVQRVIVLGSQYLGVIGVSECVIWVQRESLLNLNLGFAVFLLETQRPPHHCMRHWIIRVL